MLGCELVHNINSYAVHRTYIVGGSGLAGIEGQAATCKRGAIQALAVSMVLLPLAIGALAYMIATQMGITVGDEPRIVESLAVKITYSPELVGHIVTYGRGNLIYSPELARYIEEIGDLITVEWSTSSGEVKITVANETVGTFMTDELKANVKLLNLTVEGLPLKITVAICSTPILNQEKVPDYIRSNVLRLMENQSFIKWVRSEGFRYTVTRVMPLELLTLEYPIINGVLVDLTVENLKISYHLYFNEPYILAASTIPEELKVSAHEMDNYGVYRTFICEGGNVVLFDTHLPYRNITRPEPPVNYSRLDITDSIKEEVLRIMRGNLVLARLLGSDRCEIKKICGWQYDQNRRVNVILVCEKIKGYGTKVGIDFNAGIVDNVYLCPESAIAKNAIRIRS